MTIINLLNAGIIAAAAAAPDAAAAGDAAAATGCAAGGWTLILMYAVIIGFFYLILIRPQNKRREQEEQMRKSVEVGDEIITIGGICGRVVSIKEDETLVIETGADRNKMKIKTWAVSTNETARGREEANPTPKQGFFAKLFNKNKGDVK